ncbi:hypothetical protein QTI34_13285 [Clostridium perfringens]|uniref:DUF3800 domain-containing protein n=1 Tax=Clostridium perfringens TaxID=1502 RepID=A0AAW9IEF3_CLOPF|nr:hypothetical protein [Clostridium perfringens]EIF6158370.1 hypothetical protein [Clostridium perfringens]EJT6478258.1 hypothetical protein [Clostridium perfringens]MDM0801446.1 hypothetical protein [Clostridium perfringens]MDZ4982491.1 hypothetical protein [Clostridium perfringens]MDZ4998843.1 hypothetical protein [Clostridium perfringens]
MYPIGTYDRFIQKIKGREGKNKPRYLGVLFCDIEQQDAKEYIINYMEVFNKSSGESFDFYIPGYLNSTKKSRNNIFQFRDEKYEFNRKVYNEFCDKFIEDFKIEFPYVATLVLLEYKSGNFKNAKKAKFNLEEIKGGLKNSGFFFDLIFKVAKDNEELQYILDDVFEQFEEKPQIGFTLINQITSFFSIDLKDLKETFTIKRDKQKKYILK